MSTPRSADGADLSSTDERIRRVEGHDRIRLLLDSTLTQLEGFVGNFSATVVTGKGIAAESETVEVGSVVVCTGYRGFDAQRVTHYGYGKLPNVVTSFELERMLRRRRIEHKDGRQPRNVSIIHCIGSRSQKFHGYCSRVWCMTALKYAQEIKAALPGSSVCDLHIDMHAFGKGAEGLW
ncbi:MAG: hypothetical protein JW751_18245 [Polyangiaceae bacterium]|nr:hypothetical protein [Polyangiaceae bacterium]